MEKIKSITSITLDVLKADIARGEKGEPNACAIARAAKRQGLKQVEVLGDTNGIVFEKGGKSYKGTLPAKIRSWISKFDNDGTVKSTLKPFSFSVAVKQYTPR